MKKQTLILFVHFMLIINILLGVLLVGVAFISYDVLASLLNRIAIDGRLDFFTKARYQIVSGFIRPIGISLIIIAGILLNWWPTVRENISMLFSRLSSFKYLLGRDAKILIKDFSPAGKDQGDLTLISGIMFLAVAMRLANLFIPLEFDEAYTYNAFASWSLWHTISDYHMPNNHVFLTIFINILVHLFGNQQWLLRLPSFVFGILMIPACYLLAKRLYGKEAAILSTLFVAVFPVIVKFSVLARGYIIVSFCTVMIFLLGDYVRENKNRMAWLMLVGFSAMGFFTIPIMLYSFGALFVWLFLVLIFNDITSYRTKVDFIKYLLAGGVASVLLTIALYLPIFLNKSNPLDKNQFLTPLGWDVYPVVIWLKLKETWVDWTALIPGWMTFFGVLGLILSIALHNKIAKQKIPTQIPCFIWIVGFIIIRRPIMEVRMWTFLAAPLLIWSAGGLVGMVKLAFGYLDVKRQPARVFSNVILAFVLVLGMWSLWTIPERWKQRGSVENTVIYLKSHLREGDVVATSNAFKPQLKYYFLIYNIPLTYMRRTGPFDRVFVLVRSVNGSAEAGDTLELVAPRSTSDLPAINLATAQVMQQYEDITLYEGYPYP